MRRYKLIGAALCAGVLAVWGGRADAQEFSALLDGFQELGALNNQTGAVLSDGTGTLQLNLNKNAKTATYILTYNHVGTTPPKTGKVSVAHIHFGKNHTSGGVLVFFCTNQAPPPGPLPPKCPDNGGTVTGTFVPTSVQAIAGQNVVAGDFDALVDALTSNTAYANIHTTSGTTPDTAYPAGEIRGQIRKGDLEQNRDRGENHEHR